MTGPAESFGGLLARVSAYVRDAVLITRETGTIQFANAAVDAVYGYEPGFLIGKHISFLSVPEDIPLLRISPGSENIRRTMRHRRADRTEILVDLEYSLGRTDTGEPALCYIISDITPIASAQDVRREAVGRIEAIVSTAADAIIIIDERGIMREFNIAAEKLFQYSAEEMIGRNVSMIMPSPHSRNHDGYLENYMRTGVKKIIGIGREVLGLRKDGTIFPARLSVGEYIHNGRRYFTGFVYDISQLKHQEEEIRQLLMQMESKNREMQRFTDHLDLMVRERTAELIKVQDDLVEARDEAERASAAKTRFLAAASHDLRQPLQAASLMVYLMSQGGPPPAEALPRLKSSLDSLARLLNSLLDIGKLEAGLVKPDIRTVSLRHIVHRVLTDTMPIAERKGLEVREICADVSVETDPVLLEQVVRNLVDNAIKYTERGRITIGTRRKGRDILLQIHDTGIGIPVQKQEAIFEEFYQIDNPARKSEKGLGLGLAIVRRLSGLLRHPLHLQSASGRGSMFQIALPVAAHAQIQTDPEPHKVTSRTATIAVVEDDPEILAALQSILRVWGFRVIADVEVDRVTALVGPNNMPDLVIADYRLTADMRGDEAIRRIQKKAGRAVPGIILTGDTAPERLNEAAASGFRLLHKPIDPEALRTQISKILENT